MQKATVYLFTSPTCPYCPAAKSFIREFKKTRNDFVLKELSTATPEGRKQAQKFGVMSVPTFIIKGPGYPHLIGLRGVQSAAAMNKYLDMSYGSYEEEQKPSLREKLREGIKLGKIRIRF